MVARFIFYRETVGADIIRPVFNWTGLQSLSHTPVLNCVTAPFAQGSLPSGLLCNPSSVFSAASRRKSTFPSGKAVKKEAFHKETPPFLILCFLRKLYHIRIELVIFSLLGKEVIVVAAFNNFSLFKNKNRVGVADC